MIISRFYKKIASNNNNTNIIRALADIIVRRVVVEQIAFYTDVIIICTKVLKKFMKMEFFVFHESVALEQPDRKFNNSYSINKTELDLFQSRPLLFFYYLAKIDHNRILIL